MPLTQEQSDIQKHVITTTGLTLVESVAGSGKTTLLKSIANALPHTNGLYLAYNNTVATEASNKFPNTTHCMTTHSLAYKAVVKPYKLKLGVFNHKSILDPITYEDKYTLTQLIKKFCLSRFLEVDAFVLEYNISNKFKPLIKKYLSLMNDGKIECTHDFYLKLFHLKLAYGELKYTPFDFIMLDEAGDLNEATLEIFRLLPSERKVAVGDPFQNIYGFNHTINCFELLKDEGTLFRISISFRVSNKISPYIELFCTSYLNQNMSFKGVPINGTISTRGYITRTNAALIKRMIELNEEKLSYGLVRRPSEIFKLPLILCGLKHKGFIYDPAFTYLQEHVNQWHEDPLINTAYKSALLYIADLYKDDVALIQAIQLVLSFGKNIIIQTYEEARKHCNKNQNYILATAHSCKGLEFDEVTIADDLNKSISKLLDKINSGFTIEELTKEERNSLNLYYVAVTRGSLMLNNAIHL